MSKTISVTTFAPPPNAHGENGPEYVGNLRKGELRGIIQINKDNCVGCDTCRKVCPVHAISGGLGVVHHIREDACLSCGQCLIACPFNAIEQMSFVDEVMKMLDDPTKLVVAHPSPAVRVSICEEFGGKPGDLVTEQFVNALEKAGFVTYDVNQTADQTIIEEGMEFVKKIRYWVLGERGPELEKASHHPFPHFTSCCPAWVKNCETFHPGLLNHLSTAKSPIQMGGAIAKTWAAEHVWKKDPRNIYVVAVTPCTAKIFEAARPEMNSAWKHCVDTGRIPANTPSFQDIDAVVTAREIAEIFRRKGINPLELPKTRERGTMEIYTGAGTIFGTSGGVMEAALRTAYYVVMGKNPPADAFKQVRSQGQGTGVTTAEFHLGDAVVRTAVVSGLGNTRKLLEQIEKGEVSYDFVEVMACPGGCVGGGGQPIHDGEELAFERGKNLYALDSSAALRFSHENPDVQRLYAEYLGEPTSHRSHQLLHTDHNAWTMPRKQR